MYSSGLVRLDRQVSGVLFYTVVLIGRSENGKLPCCCSRDKFSNFLIIVELKIGANVFFWYFL